MFARSTNVGQCRQPARDVKDTWRFDPARGCFIKSSHTEAGALKVPVWRISRERLTGTRYAH
jgi:hypothetical protein